MATKAEVLNYPVVGGLKGAEHEAHLQCESMVTPPIMRLENMRENRALSVMTDSSWACLM